ncbi:hypothetical protein DBR43_00005, partial [Pedobacter sp. KBW06]
MLVNFSAVYAEGSRDLYPATATGNRAFLYCNTTTRSSESWPFKTPGTHYVYVKSGEIIAAGSSAQGYGQGVIRFTTPTGDVYTSNVGGSTGRIRNRTDELNGPKIGSGSGYTPFEMSVPASMEGVWKVEFIAPGGAGNNGLIAPSILATANWSQPDLTDENINLIAAWDVSVRASTATEWLKGRVFANVLNLHLNGTFLKSRAYFATHYILTKDGRAYRVQTNGSNGVGFTFFSNSNGFAVNSVPIYKSLNESSYEGILAYTHNPTGPDDGANVTHKIFYNKPHPGLPVKAPTAAFLGQDTWLKNPAELPKITNLTIVGVEGTVGLAGMNGAYIKFKSSAVGTYRITIPVSTPAGPADRVIIGVATQGNNVVFWDGKDGKGAFLKDGTFISKLKTKLLSAEVHFPYIDMEVNPLGLIIELTDNTTNYDVLNLSTDESVYSDRTYWDDSDITGAGSYAESSNPVYTGVNGASSRTEGHKWGSYNNTGGSGNSGTGLNSFGNAKSLDTWAYIQGSEEDTPVDLVIKVADLKIESVVPDLSTLILNKQITYTVRVKNSGPSAVSGAPFAFKAPPGFEVTDGSFSIASGEGAVNNILRLAGDFSAVLDLKNNAVVEFKIIVKSATSSLTYPLSVEASILRPADITDPDATHPILNPDPDVINAPSDPHLECKNGTLQEVCNNIKYNNVIVQELCPGTPIVPIDFAGVSGGAVEIIGALPSGLDPAFSSGNNVLKITGTPTASGTFTLGTVGSERERTTYLIKVNQPPVLQPLNNVSVCEDKNAVFTVTATESDNTYKWQFNDNKGAGWQDFAADATGVSGSNTTSITLSNVPFTSNGKQLRVIVTSALGCSSVSSVATLTVNKLPESAVVLPWDAQFCIGGTVTLTANGDAVSFQWFKNGVAIAGEINQTYTASTEGDYHVVLKNDKGCESSASNIVSVNVYPDQPKPVITSEGDLTFCSGGVVKLKSSSATGNQWIKNNRPIAGENKPELTVSTPGTYRLVVTNPCSKLSDEIIITVNPIPATPSVEVTEGNLTFCTGDQVILESNKALGNQWYKNGELIVSAVLQKYTAKESGTYTVVVTE